VGLESKQAPTGSVAASLSKQKLGGQAQFLGASRNGHKIEERVHSFSFSVFRWDVDELVVSMVSYPGRNFAKISIRVLVVNQSHSYCYRYNSV
jgi:hypothetical protein